MADVRSRQKQILDILSENNSTTTKYLSQKLGVSEMTIRRDVSNLEKYNFINVYYGGISLNNDKLKDIQNFTSLPTYSFDKNKTLRQDEKRRIAQHASTFIEPFDAIAIDNGTTCCQLLDFMDAANSCIIYTYSIEVLNKAVQQQNNNFPLFLFGGHYHSGIKIFECKDSVETIKRTHINKLFLGAVGVNADYGLSCSQQYEIDIRRALIAASEQVILLADSSKIGKSWYAHFADISDVDTLVTDNMITPEQKTEFEEAGVTVYTV